MRLLYVGRVTREKGVHTAIRALAAVRDCETVILDIVGEGPDEYKRELHTLVEQHGLQTRVSFRGGVPRNEIPQVLRQYDALVFPSEWQEPFARIVLEAMGSGLVVVGTTTGGTGEVLVNDETGLTFASGDARALAAQISRLCKDQALRQRLAAAARQRVMQDFTSSRMVDELEAVLEEMAARAAG